jgi:hypothetical protein
LEINSGFDLGHDAGVHSREVLVDNRGLVTVDIAGDPAFEGL